MAVVKRLEKGSPLTQEELDGNFEDYLAHKASTANPHSVTKTQVGLGNVDNTSDVTKQATFLTAVRNGVPSNGDDLNKLYNLIIGIGQLVGGLDASSGVLPTVGSGVSSAIDKGDYWKITVAGTISGIGAVKVGDTLIASINNASVAADFFALQNNVDQATSSVLGLVKLYTDLTTANTDGTVTQAVVKEFKDSVDTGLEAKLNKSSELVPLGFGAASVVNAFGDSFTEGALATVTAKNYVSTIQEALGIVLNNQGVGGDGGFNCFKKVVETLPAFANTYPTTLMIGFNDIRRQNTVSGTNRGYNRLIGELRAIIANTLLKTAVAANNGSVSTTGTWTTLPSASISYHDKSSFSLSGLARSSSVSGSTLTYSFTGNNLVIGTWGCDTINFDLGQFTVTVDGILKATYDPTNKGVWVGVGQEVGINHDAVILFGLGGGTHTVVIATTQNKPTYIDYIGTLQSSATAPTMLVGGLVKQTAAGYALAITATVNDTVFEYSNELIKTVVGEFRSQGYRISYVETNTNFVPSTMIDTADNIHPNDLGHGIIANNFIAKTSNEFVPSSSQYLVVSGRTSTQQSLFRCINDASLNVNIGIYASATPTSGIAEANIANVQTSASKLNFGSLGSFGWFAGGVSASTDNKMTLGSNGVLVVQNATANLTSIIASNATATQGSQVRAASDDGTIIQIVSYGSTNNVAFSQAGAHLLYSTSPNLFIGSAIATSTVSLYAGGTSTADVKATLGSNGIFVVKNAVSNLTNIIASNATVGQGSQIRASNDAGIYIQMSAYGSANGGAFAQVSACVLSSTSANMYVGSSVASSSLNFFAGGFTASDIKATINSNGSLVFPYTNTPSGTTGNQTIGKISGTVNIAAGGSSIVVTNSLVTENSIVYAVVRTNDSTAIIKNVVPAAGSFTIRTTAAVTAEISIGFIVFNA